VTPIGFRATAGRGCIAIAVAALLLPGCAASRYQQASCTGTSYQSIFLLEAQAVPSATFVPCLAPLPSGWRYGGSVVRSGSARFWIDSDRVGSHAAEVTLTRTCDVSGAIQISLPTGQPGLQRYDRASVERPKGSISYFVFEGGCVTYRFSFTREAQPAIYDEADRTLGFTPRSVYVNGVRKDAGLTLCGAEAPPCPG
jgi:hypothetical protein